MNSKPPKLIHPIVLVPGLLLPGTFMLGEYFSGIREFLEASENRILIPELPVLQTIERRARELKRRILEAYPDEPVNIIAHSSAGLVARYMTSVLGMGQNLVSITTIGTPHRGTPLADLCAENIPLSVFQGVNIVLKSLFHSNMRAIRHMTTDHMEKVFNTKCLDVPGIFYGSAASFVPDPLWRNTFPMLWPTCRYLKSQGALVKNDGFTTVDSARWGKVIGIYLGDHFSQIGHPFGFTFYANHKKIILDITEALAERGL